MPNRKTTSAGRVESSTPIALSFLGLQPIIHRDGDIAGYEVLYRDGRDNSARISDSTAASSHVIATLLGQLGLMQLDGSGKVYINVGEELLFSDVIELLPPSRTVLEILETVKPSESVIARCRQLTSHGYTLALDDFIFDENYAPLIDLASIIKVDIRAGGIEAAEQTFLHTKTLYSDKVFLAEKVETQDEYHLLKKHGFELFQGYFFASPEVRSGRRIGPSPLLTLKALEIVIREGDIREMERLLKDEPGLSIGVLRLANSVAASSRSRPVESLKQAAILLGWKQMRRYLEVVLLARHTSNENNALMKIMVARGRFMEGLARESNVDGDSAYLIGILSLADRLLGLPMAQILNELHLTEVIEGALLARGGDAGGLLALCEALECDVRDPVSMDALASRYALSPDKLLYAKIRSLFTAE